MIALAAPGLEDGNMAVIHPIQFGSKVIRRVCRSTLQAETYALAWGVEAGARVRANIADALGFLGNEGGRLDRDWESKAQRCLRHLWLTDCRSLADHLTSRTLGQCEDKSL